jgi:hypothetical protein
MPELKFDTVVILVILLPGFLAARLNQHLRSVRDQSEFDKVIEALLYSFVTYILYSFFARSFPVSLVAEREGETVRYHLKSDPSHLLIFASIAVLLSIVLSFASNHDLFGRLFRALNVSRRSWRDTIWSDVFHNFGEAVQVELSDSRMVMGWLKYFSDTPDQSSLFLEKACWVDAAYKRIPIDGPGIFITKESGVRSVTFLKWPDDRPASRRLPWWRQFVKYLKDVRHSDYLVLPLVDASLGRKNSEEIRLRTAKWKG